MSIKTVTAGSMAEALGLVEKTLGAHAVILHTRTFRRGGFFGWGGREVVEITAADGRELGRRRRREARTSSRAQWLAQQRGSGSDTPPFEVPVARSGEMARPVSAAGTALQRAYAPASASRSAAGVRRGAAVATASGEARDDAPLAGELIRQAYVAARAVADAEREGVAVAAAPVVTMPALPDTERLSEEMRSVRQLVTRMLHQQRRMQSAEGFSGGADPLAEQYVTLIQQEVAEELADQIVREVQAEVGDERGGFLQDGQAAREAVMRRIAAWMPADDQAGACPPTEDGRPRTIALVGPTGVGKTTTLAKLAATFKLKQGKRVAMITLDTYRIAAVDQLRTYAEIIGVPLQVVRSPEEMQQAVRNCLDVDVVLIDTAGRSQRDGKRLEELAAFIAAARPHETHLCIASNCTERVMLEVVSRFAGIHTDRILFTKLDEAVTYGTLLTVARAAGKRLSYITTGQEVPHQIEAGCSRRMAELVMGESGVAG